MFQPIVRRLSMNRHEMQEFEVLLRTKRTNRFPKDLVDLLVASEEGNQLFLAWFSGEMIRVLHSYPEYHFSINLHPQQLGYLSTKVFLESLQPWTDQVHFEITERPVINPTKNFGATIDFSDHLTAMVAMGYHICFDDVDSGLNTLDLISRNVENISTLKFSIFNFRHLPQEVLNAFIIAWRVFADHYQLRLVVEGVEEQHMSDYLYQNGIIWQQGYYWAEHIRL